MTTHALAVTIGTFELIGLFVLLSAPVVLTIAYAIVMARFNRNKLNLRMTEAKLLSDLAQLEAESASGQNEEVSTSTRREPGGLSYALQSE